MGEIITLLDELGAGWQILIALAVLSVFIEVTPIKVNPLTTLKKLICLPNQISKLSEQMDVISKKIEDIEVSRAQEKIDVKTHFDSIKTKLDCIERKSNETEAKQARIRILRFGDEVMHKQKHSEEHFKQTLMDIDIYEKYCLEHPEFKNNLTAQTVQMINKAYQNCIEKKSFLQEES